MGVAIPVVWYSLLWKQYEAISHWVRWFPNSYPLVNVCIAMENHHWKLTISVAIFNSYVRHYQMVPTKMRVFSGRQLWNYCIHSQSSIDPPQPSQKCPPKACWFQGCRFPDVFWGVGLGWKFVWKTRRILFGSASGLLMEAWSKHHVLICVVRMKPWLSKLYTFYQCTHDLWLEQTKQRGASHVVGPSQVGACRWHQMTHHI